MTATTRTKRDISRALDIAKLQAAGEGDGAYNPELQQELIQILTDLDARTGRRDPRVRKPKKPASRAANRPAKRSAKRPAKKARR